MFAVSTKFLRTQDQMRTPPGLDALLAFSCNVEWRGTRETCTSSVRMRQYMTREHKRRLPRLFDLNSGEKLDGVIRQVPNRCRVILCMDAKKEK